MDKNENFQTKKSSHVLNLSYNIPYGKTSRFWEYLNQGKIITTKCKICGKLQFPPKGECTKCLSQELDWIELSGGATLETFTEIIVRPVSFAKCDPYLIALGKLKEGIKILARLKCTERNEVKIGMKLNLISKVNDDGNLEYEFISTT